MTTYEWMIPPSKGVPGDVPDGMTQRHAPQPKGCCPPGEGIFKGACIDFTID
jgi:hypothetical protein